jgi:hypothetical protein
VAPYGRQDITTDRVVGADRAQFNVNSYSGRIVACARDFNSDRFGSVPSVARRELRCEQAAAREAALLTASAEMKWPKSWAVAGTFEGEFSDVTRRVRRQWNDAVRMVQCRAL